MLMLILIVEVLRLTTATNRNADADVDHESDADAHADRESDKVDGCDDYATNHDSKLPPLIPSYCTPLDATTTSTVPLFSLPDGYRKPLLRRKGGARVRGRSCEKEG